MINDFLNYMLGLSCNSINGDFGVAKERTFDIDTLRFNTADKNSILVEKLSNLAT